MPHVVLQGDIKFRDVFEHLNPIFVRDDDGIIRTMNKYIDFKEKVILLEALVIEQKEQINFLVLLSLREDGFVVRIYPHSSIKKTIGVKKTLAQIATQLLEIFPNLKVGKTNLQEFLPRFMKTT